MAPAKTVMISDYAWPDLSIEKKMFQAADINLRIAQSDAPADLVAAAHRADAILTNWGSIDATVLAAAGDNLKIVARTGIGLDNVDVGYCTSNNIAVTNVPDYCVDEVAEHALGLIFSLGRQIAHHHHETQNGNYVLNSGNPLARMSDQTVGIIGLGNTGKRLADMCTGFGFKVLTYSRSGMQHPRCQAVSVDELLKNSDYISLHMPATATTSNYMNADRFALCKPTAYLINIARGGLVDHEALENAIQNGKFAGAGLDVQVPEPPNLSNRPYSNPKVIVTPHCAFMSQESLVDLRQRSTQQVIDCLEGRIPENVVNRSEITM